MELDVVPVDALDKPARREIITLCEAAYQESFERLFEELPASLHVRARDERGRLVSHAEIVTRWLQPAGHPLLCTAYVEAVATAPDTERRGLATAVLRRVNELLDTDPAWELGGLSPATSDLYVRLGWEFWRGPLAIRVGDRLEPTPHDEQVMIRRLPRTPATLDTTALLTAEWRPGELW